MTQRLRIILPRSGVLVALAAFYLLFELPLWFVRLRWEWYRPPTLNPSDLIIVFAALTYGGYRVVAFHPFYRPDYHVWLSRTPWTSRKPLPARAGFLGLGGRPHPRRARGPLAVGRRLSRPGAGSSRLPW